jgi:DNA-binding MarR family transcriptional regulator
MKLEKELGLRRGIKVQGHEAMLNLYYTVDIAKKLFNKYFKEFGITDVQFNLMVILYRQADRDVGLTQQELSKMLLVNRSNVTSLVDRMEKANLVTRFDVPGDRRCNLIRITPRGREILKKVEVGYMEEVKRIMGVLSEPELGSLIGALERIRQGLRKG